MDDKARTREKILRKRDGIPPAIKKVKDDRVRQTLFSLPEFQQAKILLSFASFRSEVSTMQQIEEMLRIGKRVVIPRVVRMTRALKLYEITDTSELAPGYMSIPEPDVPAEREREINDVDLVILPGAAFDAVGNRLGYGGGYYDRLLSLLRKPVPLIAIAYEEQIVDSLPRESHDIRVHMIVTDERVFHCRQH
ncbi:MAG TPA: 5-formyltetrahydrofolate cyclo-ligase [Thermodesulfovibrionales bacterium]|nr:5-formyltetrahydrofolate cyclo-ligase [Thermodesulfovibrionales bacterium]